MNNLHLTHHLCDSKKLLLKFNNGIQSKWFVSYGTIARFMYAHIFCYQTFTLSNNTNRFPWLEFFFPFFIMLNKVYSLVGLDYLLILFFLYFQTKFFYFFSARHQTEDILQYCITSIYTCTCISCVCIKVRSYWVHIHVSVLQYAQAFQSGVVPGKMVIGTS